MVVSIHFLWSTRNLGKMGPIFWWVYFFHFFSDGAKNDLHPLDTKTWPYYHILKRERIVFQSHPFFRGTFIRSFFAGASTKINPVESNQMGWNKPPSTQWPFVGPKKRPNHPFPDPITSPGISRPTRNTFRKVPSIAWTTTPLVFPGPWDQLVPAKCWDQGDGISGL